jgi:hypothetical protein
MKGLERMWRMQNIMWWIAGASSVLVAAYFAGLVT